MADRTDATGTFLSWRRGDPKAMDELAPLVYEELRRLAAAHMRRERASHTLQPTALAHEAFLRLIRLPDGGWKDRAHFFAIAARAMRQILADHARRRRAAKRGGGAVHVPLEDEAVALANGEVDAAELDTALQDLAALDPRQAEIVELRFFGGLSVEEVAEVLGISPATVKRDWFVARAWLKRELRGG